MEVMEKIIEYSKVFYEKLDFAHNIEHGERVVKNAKLIQQKEGGNPFLVKAGAWLHQFHVSDNLEEVRNFIGTLEIEDELKDKLYEIIISRPSNIKENSSIEAKIVCDADNIEVISTYGTIRELLCNFKSRNKSYEATIEDTLKVQERFRKTLITRTAREMMERDLAILDEFWTSYRKWVK